jgi:hypothetical protein
MPEAQVPAGDNLQAAQAVGVQAVGVGVQAVGVGVQAVGATGYGQPGRTTCAASPTPVLHVFGRFNSYCVLCYVYS